MRASVKILLGFGAGILITVIVGVFANLSYNQLLEMSAWVRHTEQVVLEVRFSRRVLSEAQSAERAYVVTGDDAFVDQFHRSVAPKDEHLNKLQDLVKDNPEQLERMAIVRPLFEKVVFEMEEIIQLKKSGKGAEAAKMIASGDIRTDVNQLREVMDAMEAHENNLLTQRTIAADRWSDQQRQLLMFGSLIGVLSLLLGGLSAYRSAQKRERAEAELDRFFANSADMFSIVNLEGRFQRVNAMIEKVLGYTAKELLENPIRNFIHPEDVEKALWDANRIKAGAAETLSFEIRMLTKKGQVRWFSWRATPVIGENALYCVARDMTELKILMQDNVDARQAALQANEAKSQFLANMSHEIRTPMNGVIGMTQLIFDTPLNAEQTEYAESIHSSAQGLLSIINDILDFSKIEAGMMQLEITPFNLDEVLHDIEKHFIFIASHKSIHFKIDPLALPYMVEGDSSRLRQVLTNLISNAIKFTPKGSVHVSVEITRSEGDQVLMRFNVKDTGMGIPETQHSRIFQSFSQADNTTSRRFGGTGLGLSISKQLVTLMGGQIGFDSTADVGSTFWFELPFRRGAPVGQVRAPVRSFFTRQKLQGRVLIAEDNQINQKVIGRLLEKIGCKVHIVNNGLEALEALRLSAYDLVLMDCQMPQLDGYEATTLIRRGKVPNSEGIKIVAMTANAMEGDREKCLAIGMDDYVSKPLNELKLHGVLSKYLKVSDDNQVLPPAVDRSALEELSAMDSDDGVDVLLDIIDTYLTSLPEKLKTISESLRYGNLQKASSEAHHIKSSAKTLGAMRFGMVLQEVEDLQDPTSTTRRIELIEKLGYAAEESNAELTDIANARRETMKRKQNIAK